MNDEYTTKYSDKYVYDLTKVFADFTVIGLFIYIYIYIYIDE
jgi:hypothetical protein